MGIVIGFIPWIVYWILVGNIPFTTAVTVAFAITLLIQIALRFRKQPMRTLDVGNLIVFAILTVCAYVVPDDVLERWLQPLSSFGLFLIALVGLLIGRPFVREYAVTSVDEATAKSQGFRTITNAMTWMWVVAFGVMFVSAMIPPIVDGDATILDMDDPLSIICYWVVPFTVLGVAGAISAAFPPWFDKRSAELDKRVAVTPAVVPQQPPPADIDGLTISAPADSRFDEPFGVSIVGGRAGSLIEVVTSGYDLFGRRWKSRAEFGVPNDGVLDLATAVPQSTDGQDPDWKAPDGNAPVWAMRFSDDQQTPEMFVPPAEPWQLTVQARGFGAVRSIDSGTSGRAVAGRRTVLRRSGSTGLQYEPTTIGGLPGMLVLPSGNPPAAGRPAVAVFGGSEGGFESQLSNAAVLASHGYVVLAQSWISEADAAITISEVPLERFAAALTLLAEHASVDGSRLSAMAISRGAEGLLATVSRGLGPDLNALVLVSPSSVSWQALGSSGEVPDTASWTVGGRALPWVPLVSGVLMRQIIRNAWTVGRDVARRRPTLLRLRPAYENSLVAAGLLDRQGHEVIGQDGSRSGPTTAGSVPAGAWSGPAGALAGSSGAGTGPSAAFSSPAGAWSGPAGALAGSSGAGTGPSAAFSSPAGALSGTAGSGAGPAGSAVGTTADRLAAAGDPAGTAANMAAAAGAATYSADPATHSDGAAMLDAAAVRCPLLLLAGRDDQLWPSVPMARMLAAQRAAAGVDQRDQLIIYEGAGHLIRLGLLPTDAPWTNGIAFGGSREGQARAQADATDRVPAFLEAIVATPG